MRAPAGAGACRSAPPRATWPRRGAIPNPQLSAGFGKFFTYRDCHDLLPAALSTGIGAQAQKPLAIVVIGGALALAVLTRMIQPPMLVIAHGLQERLRGRGGSARARQDAAA